ncbi:MAG TPA: sigma-70 family RNA polymerase sigma factor [Opitutaceae bacterium]
MSDAELDAADIAALAAGEDAALDRLMMRWQAPLRGFLFRQLQNEQDALDLAQETFVRIYQHRERFRPGARFSTWMFQIALNLARDHLRRRGRRPTASLDEAPEPAESETPKSQAETAEAAVAVRAAIAALPDDLREAVVLFEYEDKSHAEIAEIVGATPKAVETRLYRARDLLRQRLRRWLRS